ncbi:MAG: hypothetical protein HQ551_03485 [Desulfobacteraceae bacterium]|nr:hypothetical protein [Desulfobacteraceae bacterium]
MFDVLSRYVILSSSDSSPMSIIFFINRFLGIRAVALWGALTDFPTKFRIAIKAFHVFLFIIDTCNDFIGVDTVAFRAAFIGLSSESMPARPSFHVPLFLSADLILGIITQEK